MTDKSRYMKILDLSNANCQKVLDHTVKFVIQSREVTQYTNKTQGRSPRL